ncbi:MAG: hypothetical protein RLZZ290_1273 [Pseudomonadota bacterium]
MSKTERIIAMANLLRQRGVMTKTQILERFEISEPTFKRDLEFLRDRYGADIVYDSSERVYRLKTSGTLPHGATKGPSMEMPGLWFRAEELQALLTMHQIISGLGADGLLAEHLAPLKDRIDSLLGQADPKPSGSSDQIRRRVRILPMASRRLPAEHFTQVTNALLSRKRMRMHYTSRASNESTVREVSPQRVVHYRDNWYLDAYCHLRHRLSTFSIDAIEKVKLLEADCVEISEAELEETLASGYGIFSGKPDQTAVLRFSAERSRWVAAEVWHPDQVGEWTGPDKKQWQITFPYAHDRELIMDILRHGASVEVLSPEHLAKAVQAEHQRAAFPHQPKS